MSELLSCPFCGGEAETLTAEHAGGYLFCIMCNDCCSRGDVYNTEAEAIAAWNTRAERTCENPCSVGFECSECGVTCGGYPLKDATRFSWNYCPNCGARVIKSDQDLVQEVDE